MFKNNIGYDVTEGWSWNHYDAATARPELNRLTKMRGDVAHRSRRLLPGQPTRHVVTRNAVRRHIHIVKALAKATDVYVREHSDKSLATTALADRA